MADDFSSVSAVTNKLRMPETAQAVTPAKVRRRQPDEVKARTLRAARNEFATHGFDGASVRAIATEAHVSLSLLLYHYSSKLELWKATIDDIMVHSVVPIKVPANSTHANSAWQALERYIEALVHTFANYPALHRIMTQEGHHLTERLIWLCDTYVKTDYRNLIALIIEAQKEGNVVLGDPARLRYAIVAIAAVPFTVAAEYTYLTKQNPFNEQDIRGTSELILRLLRK